MDKDNLTIDSEKFEMSNSADKWPLGICGVYGIFSKTTNKIYVGITRHKKGFRHRWGSHKCSLKKGMHDNSYLQHSYNKHGENDFYFKVLEICNREDNLEEKEVSWISKLNSMCFQNGWNIIKYNIYNKRRKYYSQNIKKNTIEFEFIDPSGNIIKGKNLEKFARERGLLPSGLHRVLSGDRKSSYGYKSTNSEFHKKIKIYKLISPEGKIYEFTNMVTFSKEHDISVCQISNVLLGVYSHTKGWHLPEIPIKFIKNYEIISPDFIIYKFMNIEKFCEKFKLNLSEFRELFYPKHKKEKYNGWHEVSDRFYSLEKDGKIYRFWNIKDFCKENNLIGLHKRFYDLLTGRVKSNLAGFKVFKDKNLSIIEENFNQIAPLDVPVSPVHLIPAPEPIKQNENHSNSPSQPVLV